MTVSTASNRDVSLHGLESAEAARRLARDGPNVLQVAPPVPIWRHLVSQLVHFFALMLWIAGALAFIGRLPQLGTAIFVVVIVNALFAFAQEYRAERAAERLRDLLPRRATVLRDGMHVDVDAAEIVVEDVVILEGGDRVPADLRIVQAHSLTLDMSTLTGESVPVSIARSQMAFAGTFVTEGEGVGVVEATGSATRLARIAALTRAVKRPKPPLALELHRVVRTIAFIAVGVGAAFFAVSILLGTHPSEGFVFAIGVTVALVPEGLLPTVTLALAIGAQRMATQHALVRRLEAVETLGSTTFICTDKTGTLTLNQMSVVEAWTPYCTASISGRGYEPAGEVKVEEVGREAVDRLALYAARCSTGHIVQENGAWRAQGDPMEAALDVFARRLGVDVVRDRALKPSRLRFPFDPRRRRMSIVVEDDLLVKGAPDSVMALCGEVPGAGETLEGMTARGLRVIAVATRSLGKDPVSSADAEKNLQLVGLVALEDPPRPEAAAAISACRRAGIRVAMVTGDHPSTAAAIAREVGLAVGSEPALVGVDLPPDDDALGELIDRDGIVLARIEPEEKLRIARVLKARGHVLAMTGDGVNDGPALQEADIGVAMGRSGTDVAREAADLVLLDDNFATIVSAIEQGRAIFSNARRFLTYHLTDNVAELTPFLVWALSGGRFPLALGVLQILALDIGTDTFSAVALGAEPPRRDALSRPPVRGRLLNAMVARRAFAVMGPFEAALAMGAFVVSLMASGWRPGETFPSGPALATASGATFATVVVAQTANAFASRSFSVPPSRLGWFSNRMLVVGASVELVITAGFLFIPAVADVLGHSSPSLAGWAVALAAGPAVLAIDLVYKFFTKGSFELHPSRSSEED